MSQKSHSDRITLRDEMDKPDLSDEELMRRYQEGEQMAFDVLFKRYSGRILGFLSKKLFQVQLAQDLIQEVFLKLHRSREQYTRNLPFAPWLFSIMRSVWVDYLKKNRKEDLKEQDFFEKMQPTFMPVTDSKDEILEILLPNQKTAVAMKVYDDATFEEIALKLETSTENARQLVSRGLRRLRELMMLKKEDYGD
ncbi:RNA polymerase sigma factor [bacterium]|nr:RNA polymerase sigma factor [bacterium]